MDAIIKFLIYPFILLVIACALDIYKAYRQERNKAQAELLEAILHPMYSYLEADIDVACKNIAKPNVPKEPQEVSEIQSYLLQLIDERDSRGITPAYLKRLVKNLTPKNYGEFCLFVYYNSEKCRRSNHYMLPYSVFDKERRVLRYISIASGLMLLIAILVFVVSVNTDNMYISECSLIAIAISGVVFLTVSRDLPL